MPAGVTNLVPGDLGVGKHFTVFTLPDPAVRVGALVCFEDTVPNIPRALVRKGAQMLVNITNDGWFLHSAGAEDHLANSILRAVENRRPLLRCANTGVTCWIDPQGRVDRWCEPFISTVASGLARIPATPRLTLYSRYGNWFAYLCAAFSALALLLRRRVFASAPRPSPAGAKHE